MNELLEKIDNLETSLDSGQLVVSIKEILEKVRKDKELSSWLEEYSLYPREEIKTKILMHPLFQEYKERETALNLFIMEMNQKLSKISKKGMCSHESH